MVLIAFAPGVPFSFLAGIHAYDLEARMTGVLQGLSIRYRTKGVWILLQPERRFPETFSCMRLVNMKEGSRQYCLELVGKKKKEENTPSFVCFFFLDPHEISGFPILLYFATG